MYAVLLNFLFIKNVSVSIKISSSTVFNNDYIYIHMCVYVCVCMRSCDTEERSNDFASME